MPDETRPLVPARKAAQEIGVCISTLHRWRRKNLIKHVVTPTGRALYDPASVLAPVSDFPQDARRRAAERGPPPSSSSHRGDPAPPSPDAADGGWSHVLYCRVSSPAQRSDLQRQIDALRAKFPKHRLVTDVASGINFRRRGLLQILDAALRGDLQELVVAHRDRLARFAFDLVKWLVVRNGARLVVDGEGVGPDGASPKSDLAEDLLAVVHVFASRFHGLRRYERNLEAGESGGGGGEGGGNPRKRRERGESPEKGEGPCDAAVVEKRKRGRPPKRQKHHEQQGVSPQEEARG